jgi:adenine/guanine phosphoribosyltransferase-like PRPP-binding protein
VHAAASCLLRQLRAVGVHGSPLQDHIPDGMQSLVSTAMDQVAALSRSEIGSMHMARKFRAQNYTMMMTIEEKEIDTAGKLAIARREICLQ